MERRRLGTTSLDITPVGFGAWSIGGAAWAYDGGDARDAASLEAVRHALDSGVGWIDTAPTYGRGHSEELVGRAVRGLGAARPLVFTKCGRRWEGPQAGARSDLRPASIRSDCESSLRRLGVEVIDLLQIHWPESPEVTPVEESWGEMRRLIDEGKTRAAGVCNFDLALLERCAAVGRVDCVQAPLSLIARDSAGALLDWCAAHEAGFIAYSPMQVGLLTDSFAPQRIEEMHLDDWRRSHPDFQPPRLGRNLALRDRLRPLAAAHGTTVSAIAIAWVLAWPSVTGAIAGASSAAQVDGWLPAADLALSDPELALIAAAVAETDAGRGPVDPRRAHPRQTNTTRT